MYLRRIRASNYRAFGDGSVAPALDWELNPGLNILVGENDAGKTGIIGEPAEFGKNRTLRFSGHP